MAKTYEPIITQTLSASALIVYLSVIPQTYTDLILIINGKLVSGADNIALRFNGDSSALYSETYLSGNGSAIGSGRDANLTYGLVSTTNTSDGMNIINIMNYSNTTTYKTMLSKAGTAASYSQLWSTLWRSTSAITSISLQIGAGGTLSFASGTTFNLYGIKAA